VEDDDEVRTFVTETLRGLNYRVLEAADGEAALVFVRQPDPIDLLLTDVMMPGMNGRALGDAAQRHRPGLRILYMTGYSRNAIIHQGRLDPGVSLIQKPFSENALAARVHGALSASAN
jgi:CheY-like chemotaxis protein